MPTAAQHRINHNDIRRCLNNLNSKVSQTLKPHLNESVTLRPNWVNSGSINRIKKNLHAEFINNGKDYQELNTALLNLTKGNTRQANIALNYIINRMIRTNANPRLIDNLKKVRATAPNTQSTPNDPNSGMGLLLSEQLGLNFLMNQQTTEEKMEDASFTNNLQQEENQDEELTKENNEKDTAKFNPEPEFKPVEYFDESKSAELQNKFKAGEELTAAEAMKKGITLLADAVVPGAGVALKSIEEAITSNLPRPAPAA